VGQDQAFQQVGLFRPEIGEAGPAFSDPEIGKKFSRDLLGGDHFQSQFPHPEAVVKAEEIDLPAFVGGMPAIVETLAGEPAQAQVRQAADGLGMPNDAFVFELVPLMFSALFHVFAISDGSTGAEAAREDDWANLAHGGTFCQDKNDPKYTLLGSGEEPQSPPN
jgi:hypothetical protein